MTKKTGYRGLAFVETEDIRGLMRAKKNGVSIIYGTHAYGNGIDTFEVMDIHGDVHGYCTRRQVSRYINHKGA